ncbi:2,3-diphosphoglycerate-dependent phosphoglycerate mutase [Litorimonas sp. WD9-15]|uniref:2,3-diphosphoglycerate-dependent phosphoglycerate mutase n=1 Tax=Litorimonas sp. WD9-15 TaxID=3418716 RepID=UPI003D005581
MTKLILVRHGQSQWNLENRFTGFHDIGLTERGVEEAKKAAELITAEGITLDIGFTSFQKRAIKTLWLTLEGIEQMHIPVTKSWLLNERHYGALTGLNKQETRDKHGDEQVHIWRRSFDVPPPQIDMNSEYHPSKDPKYAHIDPSVLPTGESLKMTCARVVPYFNDQIVPHLKAGSNVIISAHGNSLRGILKTIFNVSDDDIPGFEFPTGNPLLIDMKPGTLEITAARYMDDTRAKDLPEIASA